MKRTVHSLYEEDLLRLVGKPDGEVRIVQLHHRPDGYELTVVIYEED